MGFDLALSKRLGEAEIAVTIAPEPGITALFAPSGAGKTSVLNMVAGLMRPDSGHIRVGDETLFDADAAIDLPPERRRAGYVFQDARLFPHRRVRANLDYGRRGSTEGGWMDLDEAARFLDIAHLLDRWPRTLSVGEAQRVAIGRALISHPRFLLMDEPLSALDRARREEVLRVIERIRDTIGLPILYVSHDLAEVERLANRIVAL